MLTEGQKHYLKNLSSEKANRKVCIKPYDVKTSAIAEKIINKIKEKLPNADIRFMGASALGISGQNDVDIYVLCTDEIKNSYIAELNKILGNYNKKKWRLAEDEYEVSVYINNPEDQKQKEQIDIFKILKNNKNILKEYEILKESMNGKTYKEYQIAKYEFYNRVLGINVS